MNAFKTKDMDRSINPSAIVDCQQGGVYVAPCAEAILLRTEYSFLASGDQGGNEHTEEEELF